MCWYQSLFLDPEESFSLAWVDDAECRVYEEVK